MSHHNSHKWWCDETWLSIFNENQRDVIGEGLLVEIRMNSNVSWLYDCRLPGWCGIASDYAEAENEFVGVKDAWCALEGLEIEEKFEFFELKFTVKTQLNLIKEPEQKVSIPSRLLTIKTWWGNCPSTATWPPTICGKISISVLKFKLSMNLWRFLKFAEVISQKTLENVQKTMKNCKNFMFDRGKLFND